jgi:hypothetical protein
VLSEDSPDAAAEWSQIREVLSAAAVGDPSLFNEQLVRLHEVFPGSVKVKAYLGLALRYALIREYGRFPTREELGALGGELSPRWTAVVPRLAENELVELLEFIVGLRADNEGTRGGMLVVKSAATLGILIGARSVNLEELEQASIELYVELSGSS